MKRLKLRDQMEIKNAKAREKNQKNREENLFSRFQKFILPQIGKTCLCRATWMIFFSSIILLGADDFKSIPLQSSGEKVQPMTGLVFWTSSEHLKSPAISMEFTYIGYHEVAVGEGQFDWSVVEKHLSGAAERGHQTILRFYDTYPARPSAVPAWIKKSPGYGDHTENSEGKPTGFPDWANAEWQRFVLNFFTEFSHRYDRDPRLAFLEVGFGLWAEYHIYDPKVKMGENFPSNAFQIEFLKHLSKELKSTRWLISKDAQVTSFTPFAVTPDLLKLPFGIFDDTFDRAWEPGYNREGWEFFGSERWKQSPAGGEQLIPSAEEARRIGSHWQKQVANFHLSFVLAEQWPRWMDENELIRHSVVCGYKFRVEEFKASEKTSRVTISNIGTAPIYYPAFLAINGVRSKESLSHLLPGEKREFEISSGGSEPKLTIECDRLLPGQVIGFQADLK